MVEFLRQIGRFLNSMDAKAMTSVSVSVILLAFVILMFLYGQQWLQLSDDKALMQALARAAESPWALIGVVSVYCLLALTGFPQILLFTMTVIVFGAQTGAIYSWIATMGSSTLTFGIGHFLGGRWVKRMSGERVQRTINFLNHRGILATALIRVIPSAPFHCGQRYGRGGAYSLVEILGRHRHRDYPQNNVGGVAWRAGAKHGRL